MRTRVVSSGDRPISPSLEFLRYARAIRDDDPTWLYLVAWTLATVLSAAGSLVVEEAVARLLGQGEANLELYLSVTSFLGASLSLMVWVCVYSAFRSLNIRKVMPWLLVLGSVVCLLGMFTTSGQLAGSGIKTPASYYVVTVVVNLGFFYTFYVYFRRNGRWR